MNPLIKQVPVVGQDYGFTKTAMKVYNATSPVEAIKVAIEKIAQTVAEEGSLKYEGIACFLGNLTNNIENSSKGAVTVHSGKRAAGSGFKSVMDFGRGDSICGSLRVVLAGCEVVSSVIV